MLAGLVLGDGTGCPACPCHCTGTVPAGHAGGVEVLTLERVFLEVRQAKIVVPAADADETSRAVAAGLAVRAGTAAAAAMVSAAAMAARMIRDGLVISGPVLPARTAFGRQPYGNQRWCFRRIGARAWVAGRSAPAALKILNGGGYSLLTTPVTHDNGGGRGAPGAALGRP